MRFVRSDAPSDRLPLPEIVLPGRREPARNAAVLRNTEKSWGLVSILFHWTMAALFLGQFWLGWYMQELWLHDPGAGGSQDSLGGDIAPA
jgi:hypothetical protein